jgi:hypothetical protein
MSFTAQTQCLETEEELVGAKGVERRAQVTQDLNPNADGKGQIPKGLVKVDAVIAWSRFGELREAGRVLAPVEVARVNDYTCDGGAVAADPFLSRLSVFCISKLVVIENRCLQ